MRAKKRIRKREKPIRGLPYGRKGYILFFAGLVVGALGFLFLALGDSTISPILLVIGYGVLIPWGLYTEKSKKREGI